MTNRRPEQSLIDSFVKELFEHKNENLRIKHIYNKDCKKKNFADIEFISESGNLWVIEAKSNDSKDAHNTVHKIFGELLKETGRGNRDKCKFAILIPEDSRKFYSRLFQSIKRSKFIGFGEIIPVETVFTYGASGIGIMSWKNLYDYYSEEEK